MYFFAGNKYAFIVKLTGTPENIILRSSPARPTSPIIVSRPPLVNLSHRPMYRMLTEFRDNERAKAQTKRQKPLWFLAFCRAAVHIAAAHGNIEG